MASLNTETETVVKKIIPYLQRRGYDVEQDLDFETAVSTTDRYTKGYVDILVLLKGKPAFLIEAKRISKKLTAKDRDQAVNYGASSALKVHFVVVTNGNEIQCFNTSNKGRILWDGKAIEKIPTKDQLAKVIRALRTDACLTTIPLSSDDSLPFRPGLPLRQLNALFYRCHSAIRKIEKNEESAFADFSKLLFLKLLEEKCDIEPGFILPYSYRFHELAQKPANEADQVKDSILSMIDAIVRRTPYGDVLEDKVLLKNPRTFRYIVNELASVSFYDCSLDSKGAAFEYFVRATLKGKKLGQYFTPRELVQVMLVLVGRRKIVNTVLSGEPLKVFDPACGTGGFLVFLMQEALSQLSDRLARREITKQAFASATRRIKEDVFFGSDANEGVAGSAKMNMIIAGDGHTNIQHEDSLSLLSKNWDVETQDCDLILTNPPFGTSEADSLSTEDMAQYDLRTSKGQHLFLQKMVKATKPGGEVCTVIDEGVLNNENAVELRKWILQNTKLVAVVNLPGETFKPNKINVKSSVLYLEKRAVPDLELEDDYLVTMAEFETLGYQASGERIRGFDRDRFLAEIEADLTNKSGSVRRGYGWWAFDMKASELVKDKAKRFDFKYWNIDTRSKIAILLDKGCSSISKINQILTARGKSPSADAYVDRSEGFAIVIKAGNISKYGRILVDGADWVEKSVYEEFFEKAIAAGNNLNLIAKGDVLLASTGDGTLGKCAVYDLDIPAIADGHVSIIRVDGKKICPDYLADYLRVGFGQEQIQRLYTGSTGLIELTPDHVASIIVDDSIDKKAQRTQSRELRKKEERYLRMIEEAENVLQDARSNFAAS